MSPSSTDKVPNLSSVSLPPSLDKLVKEAKSLFCDSGFLSSDDDGLSWITVAPGRVNLIGEHTDYTGGFVLPLAIEYSTVVYGRGTVVPSSGATTATLRFCSTKSTPVETVSLASETKPPETPPSGYKWYILGVVAQYLGDLPRGSQLKLDLSVAGDVPLGSGLSSSASLEVAVARFVECILSNKNMTPKERAVRCQRAENQWCHSPCGIMDQYVSSAATEGSLLLIDCRSLEYQETKMAATDRPVLVVANSNVQHDIAGGEYPVRVQQCQTATQAIQKTHANVQSLRDVTLEILQNVEQQGLLDEVSLKRARHVVTENARTVRAKQALEEGDWKQVGELMNASHASMRDDYQVSCDEVDCLVELAQSHPGVYGSRLTGGGFGGCTVTLVDPAQAAALMTHLRAEYKNKTGKDCDCFETGPGPGTRVLAVDGS